ncbi:ester cyclase [Zhouia sp. PK063]|uniref:ester cyclase n=1 Tax=Zhouia sp. PK063 TaxID=3373602 RepID=UPI003796375D
MNTQLEQNKAIVRYFNKELIEKGNIALEGDLFDPEFINHSAPDSSKSGSKEMLYTFNEILRPAFPDLKVTIYNQVAEGDLVTTRKVITGTHTGELFGIAPTGKKVEINVIDMVRIRADKYYEHWGVNTLASVIGELKK